MIRIAIVEDEAEPCARLKAYLQRFEAENAVSLQVASFDNGTAFTFKSGLYDIAYADIYLHSLSLHLKGGEEEKTWGTLAELEKQLPAGRFVRISSHCLVNLACVRKIEGMEVELHGGERLPVSRSKKTAVLSAFTRYIGA